MIYKYLPQRIEAARKKMGLSQSELSDKLGFTSPQFISNIERNLATLPAKHFVKVARTLNINLKTLIKDYVQDEKHKLIRAIAEGRSSAKPKNNSSAAS